LINIHLCSSKPFEATEAAGTNMTHNNVVSRLKSVQSMDSKSEGVLDRMKRHRGLNFVKNGQSNTIGLFLVLAVGI